MKPHERAAAEIDFRKETGSLPKTGDVLTAPKRVER
jgi:hypothetical protein